jgi:transposase
MCLAFVQAGIKLGSVVSDIHSVSAQAIIDGLIAGIPIQELPKLAQGALRKKQADLKLSLEGELSPRHRFVLQHIQQHIQALETQLAQLDRYLIEAMTPYADIGIFYKPCQVSNKSVPP